MLKIFTTNSISEFCNKLNIKNTGIIPKEIIAEFQNIDELCSIDRRTKDAHAIACIAQNSIGNIFEIGTSHGISTYNLSFNAKKGIKIHTINLEENDESKNYQYHTHKLKNNNIGEFYKTKNVNNVVQHYGDTNKWQAPGEIDQLGMAFIDGCHDRKVVLNDSSMAYFRLRQEGFMVWHDFSPTLRTKYSWINSVMNGVEDFFNENGIDGEIIHLHNSLIGVYKKNESFSRKIKKEDRNVGLVLDSTFHHKNKWACALTPFLIDGIRSGFRTTLIQNQTEYEEKVHELDALISMEPNWASPVINYSRTNALRKKIQSIPSFIYMSDPHGHKWRQEYFLRSGLAKIITPYYSPFRLHFNQICKEKILHFPWALPDHWTDSIKLRFHAQNTISCFGGSNNEAYSLRNWCKKFDFVTPSYNSGCENKSMTDKEFFRWLSTWDAAIAAGSDDTKFLLTTPKYFEIPASGALLFAQWTADLELLGFEHETNCIIFHKDTFVNQCKEYLRNPKKYLPIRAAGLNTIRTRHTVSMRIELLQKEINEWSLHNHSLSIPKNFNTSNSHISKDLYSNISTEDKPLAVKYAPSSEDKSRHTLPLTTLVDKRFEFWFKRICIPRVLINAKQTPVIVDGKPLSWEVAHEIFAFQDFSDKSYDINKILDLSLNRYKLLDNIWPDIINEKSIELFYRKSSQILPWGHGTFLFDHNVKERRINWMRRIALLEQIKAHGATQILDYGAGSGHTSLLAMTMGFDEVCHVEYKEFHPFVEWRSKQIPLKNYHSIKFLTPDDVNNAEHSSAKIDAGYFDAVLCCDVAEHVFDPQKLVNTLSKITKDNGLLSWISVFGEGISSHINPEFKNNELSLLASAGFEFVEPLSAKYNGFTGLFRKIKSKKFTSFTFNQRNFKHKLNNDTTNITNTVLLQKQQLSAKQKELFFTPILNTLSSLTIRNDMARHEFSSTILNAKINQNRLRSILIHAYKNSIYYYNLFNSIKFDPTKRFNFADYDQIPILKKENIQNAPNLLLADNILKQEQYIDSTGGSTGTPLIFHRDYASAEWIKAGVERFTQMIGYNPHVDKVALLWGADRDIPHSPPPNEMWLNAFNMTRDGIRDFFSRLHFFNPKILKGYATCLYTVARILKEDNIIPPKFLAIESSAEQLFPQHRRLIEEVFKCKIFNMYGSREVPCIACECDHHNGLHVFDDIRYVEIVDSHGKACPPGQEGRIIVTDLTNSAMPFIRYEIGDLGVWSESQCSCGRSFPLLKKITGRISSVISTIEGKLIHGEFFTHLFYHENGIESFSINQIKLNTIELLIVPNSNFSVQSLERILRIIHEELGPGHNIKVHMVKSINKTKTGKFLFVKSAVNIFSHT